jgi:hypothetical protein
MMKKGLIFLIFIFLFLPVHAKTIDIGSWNILNAKYHYNGNWSLFGEAQLRSLKFYDNFHYYEFKGGINYKVNDGIKLTLAAGSYQTYKEGGDFVLPKNNDEFRLWPQIILLQALGKFKIEQRYRAELRFTNNGYKNRFRYRIGLVYPFGTEKNGYKPFQIYGNNEIFFTDKEPYFERNRVSFGLVYRISKHSGFQLGYLHQFDYRINDETGRDFIQIGYSVDFFRK